MTDTPVLQLRDVTLAYDQRIVGEDLRLDVQQGSFTVIIGPNACGKSTTLRALSRLLCPTRGHVLLDGSDIRRMRSKELATKLGLLPQAATAPDGITVGELVARGRYPHQSLISRWSVQDQEKVEQALAVTELENLVDRQVDELSGGQKQRAWVAMALAQDTELMLLDEPTTFLDVAHQISLLNLFADLNRSLNRTIVAVLHDLNHAARYASHLVAMRDGRIVAHGAPATVITPELIAEVFGIEATVIDDPLNGGPLMVPRHRAHR